NGVVNLPFDEQGRFRYIKFEFVHTTNRLSRLENLTFFGYEPDNKPIITKHLYGALNYIRNGTEGSAYNDKLVIRTNTKQNAADPEDKFTDPRFAFSTYSNNEFYFRRGINNFLQFEFNEPTELKRIPFNYQSIAE